MPLLQVRDCPEDINKKIVLVAKKKNRTIAQQIDVLLEKIRARPSSKETQKLDAVALIREDRDR